MITVEVKGLREVQAATLKLDHTLKGGYVAFFRGVLSGKLTDYFVERFDSEGARYGTPWAPLQQRTLRRTARLRRGGILYLTGRLRQSFLSPGAPGAVESATPFEYRRGSRVGYAIFHQEGTRHMPARPPIAVTPDLAQFWLGLLAQYVKDKTTDAGLGTT